ncbi:class I SAM-dependent methyltransferase [Methylosinus sp. Sm6]|uniref:class I SAM-dependent methyltransferase n=1 Tax=Methylosinus sp. Sm6 TaxID=2866948 RepID=UPI001C99F03D|nr:class I SAM-dependent methyltransferase [Methylosinus sp. Sm6]MBY6243149.1 class I SAM-dependent methyltransferase [Methylosinus sp. Sm6]
MTDARPGFRIFAHALDRTAIEAAYARWAPVYDLIFSNLLGPGRIAVAAIASRADGRILDVGVGTGLELPMFRPGARVVAVDLSEPMLKRAAVRIGRQRLAQVLGLARMDASRLAFPDASFACVVAPYLLTVAPSPEDTLDEFARVVRPGGEIVLVNHVSSPDWPLSTLESFIGERVASLLGWRVHFPWSIIGDWIDARPDMRLIDRRVLPPMGLFTLTRVERLASSGDGARRPVDGDVRPIAHA